MVADDSARSQYDQLFRRVGAARYVEETYGFPCSPKTLAKLACVSSHGPPFRKAGRFTSLPKPGWMTGRRGRSVLWCSRRPNPQVHREKNTDANSEEQAAPGD